MLMIAGWTFKIHEDAFSQWETPVMSASLFFFGHTGSDKFSTVLISNANETKRRRNEWSYNKSRRTQRTYT